MMKLSLLPSISQRSFQVSLRSSSFSQLVHCPCLNCKTAFVHFSPSPCCRTLATTSFFLWANVVLYDLGWLVLSQKKIPSSLLNLPYKSPCLRKCFACCMFSVGVQFLPVASLGAAACIIASWDSVRVMSSLTLVHLYSSMISVNKNRG